MTDRERTSNRRDVNLAATMLDLSKAELKASHIVRRWPNMALSKQYQLRAVALYLLYRRTRSAPVVMTTELNDIRRILDLDGRGHARYNLEGALCDIERFSREGKPTDQVCINTINRVIDQLGQIEYIIKGK